MKKKLLVCALLSCASMMAQANVTLTEKPADQAVTTLDFYDGSGNLTFECRAVSIQNPYSWTKTSGALVSVTVSTGTATATTSTAHGLLIGNQVVLTGSTNGLNGTVIVATVPSATTFTFTTTGATEAGSALIATTKAPRTTASIWSVRRWTFLTGRRIYSQYSLPQLNACTTLYPDTTLVSALSYQ